MNICVLGAGSMGIAVAVLLSSKGNNIKIWSAFKDEVDMINIYKEHKTKLPGVHIPEKAVASTDVEFVLNNSDMVVIALPSQTIRSVLRTMRKQIKKDTILVCCSKGIEQETNLLLSDVVKQEISQDSIVVALSGPSHAEEIGRFVPTAVVAACENIKYAEIVQDVFMTSTFRVYTNIDIIGVELAGALKNVIALCAGISDGLGFGDNTKAALMTRGMVEIARLGAAMGAKTETFAGLAGIGDLIVTCTSMHSRNRRAGILIGQGKSVKDALDEVKMVVEGYSTTKPAFELSRLKNVPMPITNEAYNILYEGKDAKQAVIDLMTRDKKYEIW